MSMQGEKKQIEEMAAIIEQANKDAIKNPGQMKTLGQDWFGKWYASALYEAGCRMQSEGEWLSAYDYAVKIGVTNEDRLASAKEDKVWKFCSRCEQQVRWLYNYCPNCGAKMKGGAE